MAVALQAGRAAVVASLLAVIALSWSTLAAMSLHGMGAGAHAPMAWTAGYAASIFAMWALMMVAMMLPSALPTVLVYEAFERTRSGNAGAATALFAAGYLLVWTGFSTLATAAQWALEESGLLASADMRLSARSLAAALFVAAGAYQFAPLKQRCLDACRSPVAFLSAHWREGRAGAAAMGLHHGAFCLGCCWLLMLLLFAGGVMNLLWIVPVALFVLAEKCLPGGERTRKAGGALLIAWGAAALFMAA
jgi:predicted metal-binding membrane protein